MPGITNAFNDRGWVIRDAYWIQRLFDARIRIIIGRADPSDYVGTHWLQNVNNSFVNRNFSASPAVPFPGHGPMLGISIRPTDQFYLTAGASNAYSTTIRDEIEIFHRFQLSQNTQLSVGLQLIANPGNAPDNDTAGVFYARLRTSF